MQNIVTLMATATLCFAASVAQAQDQPQQQPVAAAAETGAAALSSGEIVKIDRDGARLTIKHGPLRNLKMPGMTMAFRVSDPQMLAQLAPGDKIGFVAENVQGQLTVTTLVALK